MSYCAWFALRESQQRVSSIACLSFHGAPPRQTTAIAGKDGKNFQTLRVAATAAAAVVDVIGVQSIRRVLLDLP